MAHACQGGFAGARQLFWGDVHSTRTHFRSLFAYLSKDVALSSDSSRLDSLPARSRASLLTVVAAFLPYYAQPQVGLAGGPVSICKLCYEAAICCEARHFLGRSSHVS